MYRVWLTYWSICRHVCSKSMSFLLGNKIIIFISKKKTRGQFNFATFFKRFVSSLVNVKERTRGTAHLYEKRLIVTLTNLYTIDS